MKTYRIHYALLLIAVFTMFGCDNDDGDSSRPDFTNLVWQDEFNVDGGVNEADWSFDIGTGAEIGLPGWGNNELQSYTNSADNIRVLNGNLELTARRQSDRGAAFTSARILTKGKQEWTFGRFEARIQLPFGQGLWPAFWLLGDDSDGTVIWPQIGEIDVMEYRGQEPNIIHGSIHGPGYSAGQAVTSTYRLPSGRFDSGFHIFAVEWGPDFIDYYVDDVLYNTITPSDANGEWVFNDNSFYILLNMAVGGTFVGSPNSSTPFPQTMLVDYVRVYAAE